jgi:hypothetical protein
MYLTSVSIRETKYVLGNLTGCGTASRGERHRARGKIGLFASKLGWSEGGRINIKRFLGLTRRLVSLECNRYTLQRTGRKEKKKQGGTMFNNIEQR